MTHVPQDPGLQLAGCGIRRRLPLHPLYRRRRSPQLSRPVVGVGHHGQIAERVAILQPRGVSGAVLIYSFFGSQTTRQWCYGSGLTTRRAWLKGGDECSPIDKRREAELQLQEWICKWRDITDKKQKTCVRLL